MAKATEPRLGITRGWVLGESGQANVADPMNKNWRLVNVLLQATVKSMSITAPPGSPADGDIYIVPAAATGAWAGKTGQLAAWDTSLTPSAGWFFVTPTEGVRAHLIGGSNYQFDGTNWVVESGGGGGSGGASTFSVNAQTGTTYTLVTGDFPTTGDTIVEMNNAAANTLTIPPNSSVAVGLGRRILVRQEGAGQTTIAAGAGVTINTNNSLKTAKQGAMVSLVKRATDTWELTGESEVSTFTATGQTSLAGVAGAESLRALVVASAVNRVEVSGAITSAGGVSVNAAGTDTDVNLNLAQKGAAQLIMGSLAGSVKIQGLSVILGSMTSGNYVQVYGGVSGASTRIQALGFSSDIPLELWAKGTGRVDLRSNAYMTGDFTFVGNSRKLQGDFSTATLANRTLVQSSTANGATDFGAVPNGTSTTAALTTYNNATPTNSAYGKLSVSSTVVKLESGVAGSGTQLPLVFDVGGEKFRVDTSGQLGIGGANYGSVGQVLTSGGPSAAPSWQSPAGAGPVFRATVGALTLSGTAAEKVPLPAETFDTGSYFNTTTSRFTPLVAGYYQFSYSIQNNLSANIRAQLWKNGAVASYGNVGQVSVGSDIVFLNGSTDYVELYLTGTSGDNTLVNAAACFLSGAFLRA